MASDIKHISSESDDRRDHGGVNSGDVPSTKTVSSRKIFYCDIDDEVTTIFDRLDATKLKEVYLVVPREASLFQSLVNVKILKRKVEERGKKLHVITEDTSGIHLCHQAGLPVYERLETQGGYVPKPEDERMKITPLKATVNAISDEAPTRLPEKKLSISEFLGRGARHRMPLFAKLRQMFVRHPFAERETKFVVVSPNRQALIALISVSIVLMLLIFYVALPSSTVLVTPKSDVLEQTVNLTFEDGDLNQSELASHPPKTLAAHVIKTTIRRTVLQGATGKIFQGSNAHGRLTVYNTESKPWPLIPKTRFQTPDGLVFRLGGYVTVPPSSGGQPGSLDIDVTADEFDAYSQTIGARGNIGPSKFFLPGLNPDNQKKLYAESKAAFSGGSTLEKKKISKNDLAATEDRLKKELLGATESELEKAVQEKNSLLNDRTRFSLLKGKLAYEMSEPRLSIPIDLLDQEKDQFEASGEMDVTGVYFNLQEVLDIMKAELKVRKSPDKRISRIDDSSISYRIFDVDAKLKKFKVTVTLKGIEEYDLNPSRERGERLVANIKEHIVGRKVPDAKAYILSLPEIAAVDVQNWPVWAPTIPSIPGNIDIKIVSSP